MNGDYAIRRVGPQVPDPLFATQIPAGRRLRHPPAQLSPGGQPDPTPLWEVGYRPRLCPHSWPTLDANIITEFLRDREMLEAMVNGLLF